MRQLFCSTANRELMESLIGDYYFTPMDGHDHTGGFTFAPRFYAASHNPPGSKRKETVAHTAGIEKWVESCSLQPTEPYDLTHLPSMRPWSEEFLRNSADLGMAYAPARCPNWHLDGMDCRSITVRHQTVSLSSCLSNHAVVLPGIQSHLGHIFDSAAERFYGELACISGHPPRRA